MRVNDQKPESTVRHPLETFLDLLAKAVAQDLIQSDDAAAPREPKGFAPDPEAEVAKATAS